MLEEGLAGLDEEGEAETGDDGGQELGAALALFGVGAPAGEELHEDEHDGDEEGDAGGVVEAALLADEAVEGVGEEEDR